MFGSLTQWRGISLPVLSSVSWTSLAIAVVAAVLLFRVRLSVLKTSGVCALLGLAASAMPR